MVCYRGIRGHLHVNPSPQTPVQWQGRKIQITACVDQSAEHMNSRERWFQGLLSPLCAVKCVPYVPSMSLVK